MQHGFFDAIERLGKQDQREMLIEKQRTLLDGTL